MHTYIVCRDAEMRPGTDVTVLSVAGKVSWVAKLPINSHYPDHNVSDDGTGCLGLSSMSDAGQL